MAGIAVLLTLMVIGALICGPIALILGIIALSRTRNLLDRMDALGRVPQPAAPPRPQPETAAPARPAPVAAAEPPKVETVNPLPEPPKPTPQPSPAPAKPAWESVIAPPSLVRIPEPVRVVAKPKVALEEKIGTHWILVAGVITSFIGVAFFLKWAYDQGLITPMGRTIIATIVGLACLVVGEVTRRRGYEFVAKGTTALGFAILYATTFFACKWLDPPLIGIEAAFVIAAVITAGAMAYAVTLDEIVIAALSLLGGFLSPAILSSGVNAANILFGYVLVLGAGACACAIFRRWRLINALAFLGTWLLYAGWFAQFYVSPQDAVLNGTQSQLAVATAWLGVFFAVYLVMPLLHGLVKGIVARREDVVLAAANATIVFGYLAKMLYGDYRHWLAFAVVVMAAAHIAVAIVAALRASQDKDLRLTLLTIATVFVTMAVPLYFETNAIVLAWAAEAVVLVFIGLRYGSLWTQAMGMMAMALAAWKLIFELPGHTAEFAAVLNPTFGTWMFVVAALVACHIIYRRKAGSGTSDAAQIGALYYCAAVAMFIVAGLHEWHAYYSYNTLAHSADLLHGGDAVLLASGLLLAAARPLRPAGTICNAFAAIAAGCGVICMLAFPIDPAVHIPAMAWSVAGLALVLVGLRFACQWTQALGAVAMATGVGYLAGALPMHSAAFTPVANSIFVSWLFVAAIFAICHIIYRRAGADGSEESGWISQVYYCAVVGILTMAASLEWFAHVDWRQVASPWMDVHGQLVIFAAALLATVIRPLRPQGAVVNFVAAAIAVFAGTYSVVQFEELHSGRFIIFLNSGFLPALLLVAAAAFAATSFHDRNDSAFSRQIAKAMGFGIVVLLWLLISMEIYYFWYWRGRSEPIAENWRLMMQMCLSMSWAVYAAALTVIGFWRNIRLLRYMALGLFALLLAKVFIIDTSSIKNVYRMGAFLATGVALVLVSYLYQFLKKKGFFEPKT